MRLTSILCRLPIAVAFITAAAVLTACSTAAPDDTHASPAPPTYYLALGDSLSQGVHPNAVGTSVETRGLSQPGLRRAAPQPSGAGAGQAGLPGRDHHHDDQRRICRYAGGSQLKAAEVLPRPPRPGAPGHHRHRRQRPRSLRWPAEPRPAGEVRRHRHPGCGHPADHDHGPADGRRRPGVRIVGMNYYLPALAEWRDGLPGHMVTWAAEKLAATYNQMLDRVYAAAGARVADVFGAFETADFAAAPGAAGRAAPQNVTLLCPSLSNSLRHRSERNLRLSRARQESPRRDYDLGRHAVGRSRARWCRGLRQGAAGRAAEAAGLHRGVQGPDRAGVRPAADRARARCAAAPGRAVQLAYH